jgi:hypothetical protein
VRVVLLVVGDGPNRAYTVRIQGALVIETFKRVESQLQSHLQRLPEWTV